MTNYRVSRNGELKGTYPMVKKANGTMWVRGEIPLLDSENPMFVKIGKEKIIALCTAKKFNEIPVECIAREGVSGSGLEVISYDDIRKKEETEMTPAQKEKAKINNLYFQANKRLNDSDDNNTSDHFSLLSEADYLNKQWKIKYPKEAKEEEAQKLVYKAEEEESNAVGALVYDADGWLNEEEKQKRHDEFISKAMKYRSQAEELRKE